MLLDLCLRAWLLTKLKVPIFLFDRTTEHGWTVNVNRGRQNQVVCVLIYRRENWDRKVTKGVRSYNAILKSIFHFAMLALHVLRPD